VNVNEKKGMNRFNARRYGKVEGSNAKKRNVNVGEEKKSECSKK
jgi:hypothetical protein